MKKGFYYIRDMSALVFVWLMVIKTVTVILYGEKNIGYGEILQLMVISLIFAGMFYVSFRSRLLRKRGFVFRSGIFLLVVAGVETVMILQFKLFRISQVQEFMIFVIVMFLLYGGCLFVNEIYGRLNQTMYTEKLKEYRRQRPENR